jgi:hypothetical protein
MHAAAAPTQQGITHMQKNLRDESMEYYAIRAKAKPPAVIISPGVAALGAARIKILAEAICIFDDFNIVTNNCAENFCDGFLVDGLEVLFWVDYFDDMLTRRVSDPSSLADGRRVIIMKTANEDWTWNFVTNRL